MSAAKAKCKSFMRLIAKAAKEEYILPKLPQTQSTFKRECRHMQCYKVPS